jgi:hypothetical protein
MTNADRINEKLSGLTAQIDEARARLDKGEVVNLSYLDEEVEQLCQQALSLPPHETAKIQEPMADMISRLEQLSVALKDFQTTLKNDYDLE